MVAAQRSLTCKDFQLVNRWVEDVASEEVFDNGVSMYIIDQSTGRKYLNHSDAAIRINCVIFSTIGTPVFHSISLIGHTAYRITKLISGAHFWAPREEERVYAFQERGLEALEDLFKVVSSPLVLCALEVSAIYGLFHPQDGRKLYASLERFSFNEKFFLAPCFQPEPTHHLLGGNLRVRDAL